MRRAAIAVGIGAILAAALRVRGTSPAPPDTGGWRELELDDLGSPTEGKGSVTSDG